MTVDVAVKTVLAQLKGLGPYIYHSATTGSVYIKFKEERLRSLRVSDHDGIEKYKYKWNLRKDMHLIKTEKENNINRFYYPFEKVTLLCIAIQSYYNKILEGDAEIRDFLLHKELFKNKLLSISEKHLVRKGNNLYRTLHMLNVLCAAALANTQDTDEDIVESLLYEAERLNLYDCNRTRLRRIILIYFPILSQHGKIDISGKLTDRAQQSVTNYKLFLRQHGILR